MRDRPLAALGRGVDGAELALALTTWSSDVRYCTNGSARPSSKVCAQLERYGVGVRGDRIVRVEGRTHLEWLVFRRGRVRCAGLFIQHGCAPQSDLAAQLDARSPGAAQSPREKARGPLSIPSSWPATPPIVPHAVVVAAASGAEAAFAINAELREQECTLA